MNKIKFSEDYEKLPVDWAGTEATLIGVYPEKVKKLKARYSLFLEYDTKVRGEDRHYPLNFNDALILVFITMGPDNYFPPSGETTKESLNITLRASVKHLSLPGYKRTTTNRIFASFSKREEGGFKPSPEVKP